MNFPLTPFAVPQYIYSPVRHSPARVAVVGPGTPIHPPNTACIIEQAFMPPGSPWRPTHIVTPVCWAFPSAIGNGFPSPNNYRPVMPSALRSGFRKFNDQKVILPGGAQKLHGAAAAANAQASDLLRRPVVTLKKPPTNKRKSKSKNVPHISQRAPLNHTATPPSPYVDRDELVVAPSDVHSRDFLGRHMGPTQTTIPDISTRASQPEIPQHQQLTGSDWYSTDSSGVLRLQTKGLRPAMEPIFSDDRYHCAYCIRNYKYRKHALRHTNTHLGPRFMCSKCNRLYYRQDSCFRHINTCTVINVTGEIDDSAYGSETVQPLYYPSNFVVQVKDEFDEFDQSTGHNYLTAEGYLPVKLEEEEMY